MDRTQEKYRVVLIFVALALVTFVAFEQVRHNDFVNLDDNVYVIGEPHISGGITVQSVFWAFTKPYAAFWHPLTSLSHMLDCELFGLNPQGHHITSLLLHIANTLLLFWVLKNMTGVIWPSAFVAAAFALHPLHVESVAWVSERKDVLSTLFWMLTMAAYLRYVKHPTTGKYLLTILFFTLGLMAKPIVITLPFVLLLLDYWPLGRLQTGQIVDDSNRQAQKSANLYSQRQVFYWLVFKKVPFFVLSAVASVVAFLVQKGQKAVMLNLPLSFRIANGLVSYVSYIGKTVYPGRLACSYPLPSGGLPTWQPMVCFIVLIAVTVGVVYAAKWRRYLVVGWLWYLGTLVPVIGLVQVGSHAMADRYTYLPLIGVFIMVAWGAAELSDRWRYGKIVLGVSAGIVLTAMLMCTRMQVRYWRNSTTLFEHALDVAGNNSLILCNLGYTLQYQGRLDEAISRYNQALEVNPNSFQTHYNLGNVLSSQGKLDEAVSHYREALRIEPNFVEAHNNLGNALGSQGKFDEALVQFREALRVRPHWPSMDGMASVLLIHPDPNIRDPNRAVAFAERAAELTKYQNPVVLNTLATAYAAVGQFDRAIATSQTALALASAARNEGLANYIRKQLELYKRVKR